MKTAIKKSSKWADFPTKSQQMWPVYETYLSVRTKIDELPSPFQFLTAANMYEFVAQLDRIQGHMNPTSYGPTEPHLWLVGKIARKSWDNCIETSERKARTHSYDDLLYLLMELAMDSKNEFHMDKYLRKHLRTESPPERNPCRKLSQPCSHPSKSRGGALKHI